MTDSKAELEKEIHSLKTRLGKAEARVAELEEDARRLSSRVVDVAGVGRVFGPGAVPLEQR